MTVIFVMEKPSPSVQGHIIMRATQALPTFSSSFSDTSSSLGKYLLSNMVNSVSFVYNMQFSGIGTALIVTFCCFAESLPVIAESPRCEEAAQREIEEQ